MSENPTILLAEDNPADVFLIREALRGQSLAGRLHVARDGEEAIRFIEDAERSGGASHPDIVLLDLNLPKRTGMEVLARLRRSTAFGDIPVAILSSSRSPQDAAASSELRAERFFTKPSDYDDYMRLGAIVKEMLNAGSLIA